MKYSPKRKGASSRLRKGNTPGIFGDTIFAQIIGLSQGHCQKAV